MRDKKSFRPSQPLLLNFVIWLLGLAWIYNPILSIEVLLHETGHAVLAMLIGSRIVEFELSPPHPHVTIDYPSIPARNVALTGGFLFTFFPYCVAFFLLILRKSRFSNFFIWPIFATFPSSWHDFTELGLKIPYEPISIIFNLGSLLFFLLLNQVIIRDIVRKTRKCQADICIFSPTR